MSSSRRGRSTSGFESNAQVARFLNNARIFDLGFDYVSKYPEIIARVTAGEIREAAAKHLTTTDISLVVAGPETARPASSPAAARIDRGEP
jgi:predicted Zn-dependent peptidase